jgi:energy-coupling factor transport system permease protein
MIRDITIGQYYPEYSIIHKLDPRIKVLLTFLYIASLFFVKDFLAYGFAVLALAGTIRLSRVPLRFILRGLKPILLILAMTFLMNMFMTPGKVLVQLGFLKFTDEGIYNALFMSTRLILLILGTSILTLTTKPMKLTDGIESMLNPFKRFRLPAHEIAMMMTIALRFIPTLLGETDKIMKAQQSRGADFETGNIFHRAKNMVPILIPLFIGAFRIAIDLAMAMESRCYRGGEGRTKLHPLKVRKRDYLAVIFALIFLGLIIVYKYFITIDFSQIVSNI